MDRERHRVFVYGTLTDPDRVDMVLDDWRLDGAAELVGLHPVEARYPTLAPGGRTRGWLLETSQLAALDAYEGVDRGLYLRVAVPLVVDGAPRRSGSDPSAAPAGAEVWVYVGDPGRLDVPVDWPGAGPLADRVRRYVEEAGVRVARTANR